MAEHATAGSLILPVLIFLAAAVVTALLFRFPGIAPEPLTRPVRPAQPPNPGAAGIVEGAADTAAAFICLADAAGKTP